MALSDPQTITINGVAKTLARTSTDTNTSIYRTADSELMATIAHQFTAKRARHFITMVHSKVAPDPLFPAQNSPYSSTLRLTSDVPLVGYTVSELQLQFRGFAAWLTAASEATYVKVLGGEN